MESGDKIIKQREWTEIEKKEKTNVSEWDSVPRQRALPILIQKMVPDYHYHNPLKEKNVLRGCSLYIEPIGFATKI